MRATFFVVLFISCISLSVQAQGSGAIKGRVLDAKDSLELPFVLVCILDPRICTEANIDGEYNLKSLSPGIYNLEVKYPGYKRDTIRSVVVHSETNTFLDIYLEQIYPDEGPWPMIPAFSKKSAITIGISQGVLVSSTLIGLHQLWYKQYPRESFHTFNDAGEWNQMDKLGHFQSSYSVAQITTNLWDLSHMNHRRATWIGGLTSFGYLTAIEIMDGYSSGWGFSASDMIANTAGSALFISQELLLGNQIVIPKFGFSPSPYAEMRPDLLGHNFTEQLLKDYNGQTYWLSVNIASVLQPANPKFPTWLNIAFGYGANGMTGGHQNPVMYNTAGNEITVERYRQYYLSLDIDLRRIPTRSRFLRALFNTINFIKIPAPAIEVNKFGIRGHVLKF